MSLNDIGPTMPQWRYFMGGSWGSTGTGLRAAYRAGVDPVAAYPPRFGIRLFVSVRLPESGVPGTDPGS
jgi:hypothetical protein